MINKSKSLWVTQAFAFIIGRVEKMRFSEMRKKEVISIRECRRLGHICDLEIDEKRGQICSIVVPGCHWIGSFWRDDPEIVIPYSCIRQFGADIILVDI